MLDDVEEVLVELDELEVDGADDGVDDDPDDELEEPEESEDFAALDDDPESDDPDDGVAGRSELLLVERESLR